MASKARVLGILAILGALGYAGRVWIVPVKAMDLWFHMKAGEWVFANHRVPPGDLFSAGFQGREWIVNAWLSDLVFWAIYRLGGPVGAVLLQVLVSILVFGLIGFSCYRLSGRPALSIFVTFLALAAGFARFTLRPELFTLLLLTLTLTILFRYKLRLSDRILGLVPLGLVWPNLHMGFTAGIASVAVFLIGESAAAAFFAAKGKPIADGIIAGPRLKRLALAAAGMALATLVNPYGPKAWSFMAKLFGQFDQITEWMPLFRMVDASRIEPLAALGALAIVVVIALALSRRPQDLTGLLLAGLFAVMALKFSRQAAQFCLVAPFVVATAARGNRPASPLRATLAAGGALAAVLAAWLALVIWDQPRVGPFGFGLDKTECSTGAIRFIREQELEGAKLFNTMESGGWILWNLGPRQPVYIDGRLDMYGLEAYNRYRELAASPEVGQRLKAMGFDYCYVRYFQYAEWPLAEALSRDANWALVYFDDSAAIYACRNARNRELVARKGYEVLIPQTIAASDPGELSACAGRVLREAKRTADECPDSARADLAAGIALQKIGRSKEALARLRLARRDAVRWEPGMLAELEDYLARASLDLNDTAAAIRHFREAVRLGGENKETEGAYRNNLAHALIAARRFAEAEAELNQAQELGGGGNIARIGLGQLRMAQRNYSEAERIFREVLEQSPGEIAARILLAESLARSANPELALTELEAAARMDRRAVAGALSDPEFDSLRNKARFKALLIDR